MMWQVSPVAAAPTMRFVETILPVNGDLFLYVLTGIVDWSQYGSASRKFCFLLKMPLIALRRPICTSLALVCTAECTAAGRATKAPLTATNGSESIGDMR